MSVSWHFSSCRQTMSGRWVASQRNSPLFAAERTPLTLSVITRNSTAGERGDAAVRGGPLGRLVQELLDFADLLGGEQAILLQHRQHVPPRREVMQPQLELLERGLRVGEDVVVEVD